MIYLVIGMTGVRAVDRCSWIVCAYTDQGAAEEHAHLAEQAALRLYQPSQHWEQDDAPPNYFDPHMRCIDGPSQYQVQRVTIRTKVPTLLEPMVRDGY